MSQNNTCCACGEIIPEGRLVCPSCERGVLLPCKIGDVVFIIGRKYRAGRYETWINTGKFSLGDLDKLGKTVFLSREDAENALEKLKD